MDLKGIKRDQAVPSKAKLDQTGPKGVKWGQLAHTLRISQIGTFQLHKQLKDLENHKETDKETHSGLALFGSVQKSTGQDWSGLDKLVKTGQYWAVLVKTGQDCSGLLSTGWYQSGLVRTSQFWSELVRTCQDWSGLVRIDQDWPKLVQGFRDLEIQGYRDLGIRGFRD